MSNNIASSEILQLRIGHLVILFLHLIQLSKVNVDAPNLNDSMFSYYINALQFKFALRTGKYINHVLDAKAKKFNTLFEN